MRIFLFLAFIAIPILEIFLFIQAGQIIGVLPTIALTVVTAIAGSFLMRVQGFTALNRFSQAAAKGEMPVTPVIDGIGIFAAALLLLTPGFFTDAIGLLLFIPPVRRAALPWIFSGAVTRARVHVRSAGASGGQSGPESPRKPEPRSGQGEGSDRPQRPAPGFQKSDNVIDAEFETIEPKEAAKDPGKSTKAKRSPWRYEK